VHNAFHPPFVFGLCSILAATNAAFIVSIGWWEEQGTEPQVCAPRLHSDDNPTSSLGASPTFSLREMFVDEPLSFDDILARRKVLEARIDAMAQSLPGAQPSGRYA